MRYPSFVRAAAVGMCGVLLLAGCSDDGSQDSDDDSASPAPSDTTSEPPPPPPPAPKTGRCYTLSKEQVGEAHSDVEPVACKKAHTTQTYLVGKLRQKTVGASDTIKSAAISKTVDDRCSEAFGGHVGGDDESRTLARLRYVWFVPTEEEFARGARWFRCDVVGDRRHGVPATLPKSSKGLLDGDDAIDTWGTCDQTDGELNAESEWRMCSQPHNRKAISVVSVGDQGASWPGPESLKSSGDECESAVRSYLDDPTGALQFSWSYPTKEQWKAGRRYGMCWTSAES